MHKKIIGSAAAVGALGAVCIAVAGAESPKESQPANVDPATGFAVLRSEAGQQLTNDQPRKLTAEEVRPIADSKGFMSRDADLDTARVTREVNGYRFIVMSGVVRESSWPMSVVCTLRQPVDRSKGLGSGGCAPAWNAIDPATPQLSTGGRDGHFSVDGLMPDAVKSVTVHTISGKQQPLSIINNTVYATLDEQPDRLSWVDRDNKSYSLSFQQNFN